MKDWYRQYRPRIVARMKARLKKDYALADQIKEELLKEGITVELDGIYCVWGPTGKWEKETTSI